jgi:hypothetical protein
MRRGEDMIPVFPKIKNRRNLGDHNASTWLPQDHPRWPAGSTIGGEFRPKSIFGLPPNAITTGAFHQSYYQDDVSHLFQNIDFSHGRHDAVVNQLVSELRDEGLITVTELSVHGFGINFLLRGRVDVMAYDPVENMWSVYEVKTGKKPRLRRRQAQYLAWLEIGWHITSDHPKARELYLEPGDRFPPMIAAIIWEMEKGKKPFKILPGHKLRQKLPSDLPR